MGEIQDTLFPLESNRSVKVRAETDTALTMNTGALLLRELGQRLGLWSLLQRALDDPRDTNRITHPLIELVRTAVLLAAQGWSRLSDADFLRQDPALRLAVSKRKGESPLLARQHVREPEGLPSQPTLSRLLAALSTEPNRRALADVLCSWAAHRQGLSTVHPRAELTVDVDSLPLEVHGQQVGSAYNAHYHCHCFHPLLVSWEFGDFLGASLREGNVHTAKDALDFVLPFLDWASAFTRQLWLRMDAGFPDDAFLGTLEARGYRYVARLKTNARLERMAWPHVDRIALKAKPEERLHTIELRYRARSWQRPRRVVLVIDERPLELMPPHFFLICNASRKQVSGSELLDRYRRRGITEKDYGDWLNALDVALSSTNRAKETYRGHPPRERSQPVDSFAVNETTLLLSMLSANLLHAARILVEKSHGQRWSRETFRMHVLVGPARVARSARYVTFWIQHTHAQYWHAIANQLAKLCSARGSPHLLALPGSV
jgi:hypothetical protein